MGQKSTEKTSKVKATSSIWGYATGMLAICIPLVVVTESGILLPFLVALSAAGRTAAIWFSPDKPKQEETELTQTMKILEERVINLETIYVSLPNIDKPLSLTETDNH